MALIAFLAAVLLASGPPSVDERLDLLLGGMEAVEIDQGPGVFEIELSVREPFARYLSAQDLAFLEAHRGMVTDRLLADLEHRGSRLAALLLGWLGDKRALPELRRRLLTESDSYGWETSFPTLFSEGENRGYHAYSRAIERLTGQPLEEAVHLNAAELSSLIERADHGDDTALILLYRLAPEVAREMVFESFREFRQSCFAAGNTIRTYGLLAPGTERSKVVDLLGPPDRPGTTPVYCCGNEGFRVVFDGDRVVAFESEYRDSEHRGRWCGDT